MAKPSNKKPKEEPVQEPSKEPEILELSHNEVPESEEPTDLEKAEIVFGANIRAITRYKYLRKFSTQPHERAIALIKRELRIKD